MMSIPTADTSCDLDECGHPYDDLADLRGAPGGDAQKKVEDAGDDEVAKAKAQAQAQAQAAQVKSTSGSPAVVDQTIESGKAIDTKEDPKSAEPSAENTIMVRNLPCRWKEKDVRSWLRTNGLGPSIERVVVPLAPSKKSNWGYGFVSFKDGEAVKWCYENLDGTRTVKTTTKVVKILPAYAPLSDEPPAKPGPPRKEAPAFSPPPPQQQLLSTDGGLAARQQAFLEAWTNYQIAYVDSCICGPGYQEEAANSQFDSYFQGSEEHSDVAPAYIPLGGEELEHALSVAAWREQASSWGCHGQWHAGHFQVPMTA